MRRSGLRCRSSEGQVAAPWRTVTCHHLRCFERRWCRAAGVVCGAMLCTLGAWGVMHRLAPKRASQWHAASFHEAWPPVRLTVGPDERESRGPGLSRGEGVGQTSVTTYDPWRPAPPSPAADEDGGTSRCAMVGPPAADIPHGHASNNRAALCHAPRGTDRIDARSPRLRYCPHIPHNSPAPRPHNRHNRNTFAPRRHRFTNRV